MTNKKKADAEKLRKEAQGLRSKAMELELEAEKAEDNMLVLTKLRMAVEKLVERIEALERSVNSNTSITVKPLPYYNQQFYYCDGNGTSVKDLTPKVSWTSYKIGDACRTDGTIQA